MSRIKREMTFESESLGQGGALNFAGISSRHHDIAGAPGRQGEFKSIFTLLHLGLPAFSLCLLVCLRAPHSPYRACSAQAR